MSLSQRLEFTHTRKSEAISSLRHVFSLHWEAAERWADSERFEEHLEGKQADQTNHQDAEAGCEQEPAGWDGEFGVIFNRT